MSWTWIAATTRGTSHIRSGTRAQDALRCLTAGTTSDHLICVLSDGAGSAEYGGEGASLVSRYISAAAQQHVCSTGRRPDESTVRAWIDDVRDRIAFAASSRGKTPRDFAATMILAVTNSRSTFLAQIGDGCVALKMQGAAHWDVKLWPDHGEYASTTSFITDDPEARCQFATVEGHVACLAAMTDGLERLALDMSTKTASAGFFDGMSRPVLSSQASGKDHGLSAVLKQYLDSEKVCARTDDDKTLVVAAWR